MSSAKLRLVYDNIINGSILPNALPRAYIDYERGKIKEGVHTSVTDTIAVHKHTWLEHELKFLEIKFEQVHVNEPSSDPNLSQSLYVIEVLDYVHAFLEGSVLDHVSNKALDLIRKNKMKLVIYYPFEGDPIEFMFPALQSFICRCKEIGIQSQNVAWVSGDLYTERNLLEYTTQVTKTPLSDAPQFFTLCVWDLHLLMTNTHRGLQRVQNKHPKTYDFVCYNARPYDWRVFLVSELRRRGLAKSALISLGHRGWQHKELNAAWLLDGNDPLAEEKLEHFAQTFKMSPLLLDIDLQPEATYDFADINHEHFAKSYFSVVSESLFCSGSTQPLFITEKTFKPILQQQPFLIVGCAGTLAELHRRGYQTFPEIFDESYDTEPDARKRMEIILNNISGFVRLSATEKAKRIDVVQAKLEHNYFNFINEDFSGKFRNLFASMKGLNKDLKPQAVQEPPPRTQNFAQ